MIGIIVAMSIEVNYLKEKLLNKNIIVKGAVEYVTGTLYDKEVVVAQCGIGKVFAAICTQTMINEFSPDVIINTGVAGSLSKELGIGSIAIGTDVVQYDMDTSALGDPVGFISGLDIIHIPCSKPIYELLTSLVKKENIQTQQGTIASADRFQSNREEKNIISKNFGAIACEMESGSIGQVCFVNKTDFGIIRAISDTADDSSHMDYFEFLQLAAERSISIVESFIKNYNLLNTN